MFRVFTAIMLVAAATPAGAEEYQFLCDASRQHSAENPQWLPDHRKLEKAFNDQYAQWAARPEEQQATADIASCQMYLAGMAFTNHLQESLELCRGTSVKADQTIQQNAKTIAQFQGIYNQQCAGQ